MLMVGGPRHGNDVPIDADSRSYVDLVSATTYHRRRFIRVFTNPVTGKPANAYAQELLVHESIPDQASAQLGIGDILIGRWFREEGTEVPLSELPGTPNGAAPTPPQEGNPS